MLKKLFLSLILVSIAAAATLAIIPPGPMTYWIVGTVADVSPSVTADGRIVVFFKDETTYNTNYSTSEISGNDFMVNAPNIWPLDLVVGQTYKVAIVQGEDGYGANPVDVTITGYGYETVNNLALEFGAGPLMPGQEPPPDMKIWFGNRAYQAALVAKGQTQVVSATPDIKVDVSIDEPYALSTNIDAYTITVDPGTASEQALSLSAMNMANQVFAAAELRAFSLQYTVADPLPDGEHTFEFSAQSSGALGTAGTATTLATVEVVGGPLRLIGVPLTYPSPYSVTKDVIVTIQYTLSADANIDIYVVDPTGKRVIKILCNAGTEGGSAGVNKVTWNGVTDFGYKLGNAIYVGTIIGREEGRLLAKFKLTVVD